ncbi:restriction endonuclease subunit S [Morganella morganii]|uniref:Restriction endonuclease subunit S n=1 Tax=bacterium 19GA11TI05 TaxID=2920688 RepID=A0AAU6TVG9_UNCXX|nr:restriction endonuclease subunit S [Morganella morganii]
MVPKGWEHTTFDNHIDCLTGFAFSSDGYSDEKNGTRLLRGDNIEPGKLRWENAKFWPEIYSEKLNRYFLQEGDFVIALDRTWVSSGLKVAEVAKSDLPCLLVQRVMRIRSKKTLEQNLLRQYFSGYLFEQYVKKNQTATAVPHISPNDVKGFALLLPPLPEQKKIAQILSAWDSAISVTEKLITNSQQQKKALMQQLLTGKKRLLDENGMRFSAEWCICNLSEVAYIVMGVSPSSEAYNDIGIGLPLIQGNADIKCRISIPRVYTSEVTKECSPGDILLSVRAPVGSIAISHHKACIGRGISTIKSKDNVSQKFLYQWLLWFEPRWGSLSQGSTFESINSDDIKSLKLSMPDLKEQQKIAAVLSAADAEISTLEKKLACLKDEKKALMQQLLTGKRRVTVDADAV